MVLTSVIEVTKCQIKLVSYFIHCPISVNTRANQNSVFSWSPKVRKEMQHLLKLTSLVAYAVFIFLSGLINLDKISYTKDAFVAMISIGVPSCSLLLIFSHRSGNDIVVLLNMLFLYEKRNSICLEVRNLKDLFYYGFWVFGMFGSTIGGPLFVTLLNLVNLNTPPFLGWVIPDVKDSPYLKLIIFTHGIALLFQAWAYCTLAGAVIFITGNVFLTTVFSLSLGLDNIIGGRKISKSWQFIKIGTNYRKMLTQMKHVKILESQFNTCFRKAFLPVLFFVVCFLNILSTFLCVSLGSSLFMELGKFIVFVVLIDSLMIILIFGHLSGLVNQKSKKGLSYLNRQPHIVVERDGKIFTREVASCAPLKIRFGSNYVDRKTPLVMMSFCMKTTARLLLYD
ncbi:uncharacterized protein LOC118435592 [Folsomia candida]|uniref:uncharacterized protein LOC118435592 n=1 Tax=Folsomia candida TaxID=158441 RepID=UPI001604EC93|nr:uncharacterized protein LOC118435592 [Folsomia candida]